MSDSDGARQEDPGGRETDRDFPMRTVEVGPLNFNPFVSVVATAGLWGLAGYCMVRLVMIQDLVCKRFMFVL